MTHVIGSPVWAASRRSSAVASYLLFSVSAITGGATAGALLGALLPDQLSGRIVFFILAVALLAREWLRPRFPLPQIRLQVPESLKTHRVVGPILYGVILGAAFLTYLPSAVVYIYLLALVLLASPTAGIVIGGTFGLSYAVAVLALSARTRDFSAVGQATCVKRLFASSRSRTLALAAVATAFIVASGFSA